MQADIGPRRKRADKIGVDRSGLNNPAEITTIAAIQRAVIRQAIIIVGAGRKNRWLAIIGVVEVGAEGGLKRATIIKFERAGEGVGGFLADFFAIKQVGIFAAIVKIFAVDRGRD